MLPILFCRVLKKNGRIVVLDKFLDDDESPTFTRTLFTPIIRFLFSELNRKFSDIFSKTNLKIEVIEKDLTLKGFFKILRLRKVL